MDLDTAIAAIEREAAVVNEELLAGDRETRQLAAGMDALADLAHSPILNLLNSPLPTSLNDFDLDLLLTF